MPRSHVLTQLVGHYARFYRMTDPYTSDLSLYAVPLRALADELLDPQVLGVDLIDRLSTAVRCACDIQVNAKVIEPLTSTDSEMINAFVMFVVTGRIKARAFAHSPYWYQLKGEEIAETYREAYQVQVSADMGLSELSRQYLTFYAVMDVFEARRDELALPVLVACQIVTAFPTLNETTLSAMIVGAIVHACLRLHNQKRILPITIKELPYISHFAGYVLNHHFVVQDGKWKRLLPASSELARQLADIYRQDESRLMAKNWREDLEQ